MGVFVGLFSWELTLDERDDPPDKLDIDSVVSVDRRSFELFDLALEEALFE
jgi:hypothetical protein